MFPNCSSVTGRPPLYSYPVIDARALVWHRAVVNVLICSTPDHSLVPSVRGHGRRWRGLSIRSLLSLCFIKKLITDFFIRFFFFTSAGIVKGKGFHVYTHFRLKTRNLCEEKWQKHDMCFAVPIPFEMAYFFELRQSSFQTWMVCSCVSQGLHFVWRIKGYLEQAKIWASPLLRLLTAHDTPAKAADALCPPLDWSNSVCVWEHSERQALQKHDKLKWKSSRRECAALKLGEGAECWNADVCVRCWTADKLWSNQSTGAQVYLRKTQH